MSRFNHPHIVIHGYYGAGNFGDDIILVSLIRSLRQIEPNINITVLTRGTMPIPDSDSFQIVPRFDLKQTEAAVKTADLLICGGGGIFHDYGGYDFDDHFGQRRKGTDYYAVPMEMAYLMGVPVMLYAIGAGPLFRSISRRYLKSVLNWVDVITVRDQSSVNFLKSINPQVKPILTADPAVNYVHEQTAYTLPYASKRKYAGICLRSWFFKEDEGPRFIRRFAAIADYLVKRYDYHVILFPFNKSRSDADLLKGVYENMKNKHAALLKKGLSVQDTVNMIKQIDCVIGMRLHSLIIATTNLVPAIGIGYDEKVMQYMKLADMEDCSLALKDVHAHSLKEKIDHMMTNRPTIQARLKKAVPKLKEKEKINASLAIQNIRRRING